MFPYRSDSPARRHQARAPALLLALAVTLLVAGPLPGRAAQPAGRSVQTHTVTIEGLRYSPQTLTVHRGDRVTWINKDPFPHTVTSTTGKFDSHEIAPGGSWTYVARKAGEYDYLCSLHVSMKGRLEVH